VGAAVQEFAAHGISGARVERIAQSASTSKERIYAYFRSKEELYWEVVSLELAKLTEATRMDPSDLAEYAGRLFDYYEEHPESYRLMAWGQLESADSGPQSKHLRPVVEEKTKKIADAQSAGHVDPTWTPWETLILVSELAAMWCRQSSGQKPPVSSNEAERRRRRTVVVESVRRLMQP
jgi:AcrR family transcriptional regulator